MRDFVSSQRRSNLTSPSHSTQFERSPLLTHWQPTTPQYLSSTAASTSTTSGNKFGESFLAWSRPSYRHHPATFSEVSSVISHRWSASSGNGPSVLAASDECPPIVIELVDRWASSASISTVTRPLHSRASSCTLSSSTVSLSSLTLPSSSSSFPSP